MKSKRRSSVIPIRRVGRVPSSLLNDIDRSEKRLRGKIVAVDPESRRYFVGATVMKAFQAARASFPDGRPFVFHRIGFPYVHRIAVIAYPKTA